MHKCQYGFFSVLTIIFVAASGAIAEPPGSWREHWADYSATIYPDQLVPHPDVDHVKERLFLNGVETIPAAKKIVQAAISRSMDSLGYMSVDQNFIKFLSSEYHPVGYNNNVSFWASSLKTNAYIVRDAHSYNDQNQIVCAYTTKDEDSLKHWLSGFTFLNSRNSEIKKSGKVRDVTFIVHSSYTYDTDKHGVDIEFSLISQIWGVPRGAKLFEGQVDGLIGETNYDSYVFEIEMQSKFLRQMKLEINQRPLNAEAAPVPAVAPSVAPAGDSGLAPYPTSKGAYLLVDGKWSLLPHNNGTFHQGNLNVLGIPTGGPDKIGEMVFDGTDPLPEIGKGDVVIAVVGIDLQEAAAFRSQHPDMANYPIVEMARTTQAGNGNRSTDMYRVSQGFAGIGSHRWPGQVSQPRDGVLVLRAGSVPGGTYAVVAGHDNLKS